VPGGYVKASDLPQVIPVFPLDGALLLPRGTLPLNIFEPRYLNMVDDAMAGERMIGMIQTRGGDRQRPRLQELPTPAPYRQVKAGFAEFEDDLKPAPEDWDFDRDRLLTALRVYLNQRSMDVDWSTAKEAPGEALVNSLAMALPFEPQEKQALLEAAALEDRARALTALLEIDAAGGSGEDEEPRSVQ
jgi:Lon protease-like protein